MKIQKNTGYIRNQKQNLETIKETENTEEDIQEDNV